MDRLLLQITFIFILTSGLLVNGCQVTVVQPQENLHGRVNQSVSIPYKVNQIACTNINPQDLELLWYVFKSASYYQLDLKSQPNKYQLENEKLRINWLSDNDEGVYYCAVTLNRLQTSGSQDIGNGTTLMVKKSGYTTSQVLLVILVVLLSFYSIVILILVICVKMGRATSFLQGRLRKSQVKTDTTKKVNFGAVVQELYSKRNLRKNKLPSTSDVSQENKVETQTETDDIYQNLNGTE